MPGCLPGACRWAFSGVGWLFCLADRLFLMFGCLDNWLSSALALLVGLACPLLACPLLEYYALVLLGPSLSLGGWCSA